MGTRADYLKSLKKMRDNKSQNGNVLINPSENNILNQDNMQTPTVPTNEPVEPNGWKRTIDLLTGRSATANIIGGVLNFTDNVVDTVTTIGGAIAGFFNGLGTLVSEGNFEKGYNDVQKGVQEAVGYDWTSHVEATIQQLDPRNILTGEVATQEYLDNWSKIGDSKESRELAEMQKNSSWGQDWELVGQVEEGIGEILPAVVVGVATGGASIGAQAAIQGGLAAEQAFGSSFEQATLEGADYKQALGYGATKGAINGVISALTVGVGGSVATKTGTGVVGKAGQKVGEKIFEKTGSKTAEVLASKATQIGIRAGIAGTEGFAQVLAEPVIKQLTYDGNALSQAFGDDEKTQQTLARAGNAAGTSALISTIISAGREGFDLYNRGSDGYMANYYAEKSMSYSKTLSNETAKIKKDFESGKINAEEAKAKIQNLNTYNQKIEENGNIALDYLAKVQDNAKQTNTINENGELNKAKDYTESNKDVQTKLFASKINQYKSLKDIITSSETENKPNYYQDNEGYEIAKYDNLQIEYKGDNNKGVAKMPNNPISFTFEQINGKPSVIVQPSQTKALNELISTIQSNNLPIQVVSDDKVVYDSTNVSYKDIIVAPRLQNLFIDNNTIRAYTGSDKTYEVKVGDVINFNFPTKKGTQRIIGDHINALTTHKDSYGYKDTDGVVKYLTSKEMWKLQGFTQDEYEIANKVSKETNLVKMAGDTMTVPVVQAVIDGINFDNKNLKLEEVFAGIGAARTASERLGYNVESTGVIEYDKNKIKVYNALHKSKIEPIDVRDYAKTVKPHDIDLFVFGSPCVDNSKENPKGVRGMTKGSGTESSFFWDAVEAITKTKPKVVIWENVSNAVIHATPKGAFKDYVDQMEALGYTTQYDILDSIDFGVPQTRNRVYAVSIRKDTGLTYKAPKGDRSKTPKFINFIHNDKKFNLSKEQTKSKRNLTIEEKNVEWLEKELPADLVKGYADSNKDVKYSQRTAVELVKTIRNRVVAELKSEFLSFHFLKGQELTSAKTLNTLNIVGDMNKIVEIIYDEVSKSYVAYNGEKVPFELAFNKNFKKEIKEIIRDLVQNKGTPTKKAELEQEIEHWKERTEKELKSHWRDLRNLARIHKKVQALKNKFVDPKAFAFSGDVPVPEVNFYKPIVNLIYDSVRAEGISPVGLTKFVKAFDQYTEENFADTVIGFNYELKNTIELLKESKYFDENGDYKNMKVDADDVDLVYDALTMIANDMNDIKARKSYQDYKIAVDSAKQAKLVFASQKVNKFAKNIFVQIKDNTMNVPTLFATYLGQNHPLYNLVTDEYVGALNNELGARLEFTNIATQEIPDEIEVPFKTIIKDLKEKTTLRGYKITNNELLDIYCLYKNVGENLFKHGIILQTKNNTETEKIYFDNESFRKEIIGKLPLSLLKYGNAVFEKLYNDKFAKYFDNAYYKRTNVHLGIEKNYYPTSRHGRNNTGLADLNSAFSKFLSDTVGASKSRKPNNNAYTIIPFDKRFDGYVNQITFYAEMGDLVNKLRVMFNKKIGDSNTNEYLAKIIPNWNSWKDFLSSIILERPIGKFKHQISENLAWFYSNSVSSLLGANPGTMLRQILSMFQYLNDDDVKFKDFITKAFTSIKNYSPSKWKEISKILETEAPYFAQRWNTYESIKSITNASSVGNITKVFAFGMEKTDKAVIVGLGWELAKLYASKHTTAKEGTKEFNKIASHWLTKATLTTQSNSSPMFLSRTRSGDVGNVVKYSFFMFAADMQIIGQKLNAITFEYMHALKRIKYVEEQINSGDLKDSEKRFYEEYVKREKQTYNKKKYHHKISAFIASMLLIATGSVAIRELMDRFKGKKEWDDKLNGKELALDFSSELLFNWIPYVGTVTNAIQNNSDVSVFTLDRVNKIKDLIVVFAEACESNDERRIQKASVDLIFNGLNLTGIPATNIYNTLMGVWRIIDKNSANEFNYWAKGFSPEFIKANITRSISNGTLKKAQNDLTSWEYLYSIPQDKDTNVELVRLKQEGFDALPKQNFTQYKDEKGEIKVLSNAEQQQFFEMYSQATKEITKVLKSDDYKTLDDESKSKTIRTIYDTYYNYAKGKVLKKIPNNRLGKIMSMTKGKLNVSKLVPGLIQINNASATKTLSRKEVVMELIKKLKGYNKYEKMLLLYLANYKINNASSLMTYLKSLGISTKDLKTLELIKEPDKK